MFAYIHSFFIAKFMIFTQNLAIIQQFTSFKMQNQSASGLKAGSTKAKNAMKSGTIGGNVSRKGIGRLKGPASGTKTSQSDMESEVVVVDGKVRTPKRLITQKYKEYTDQFLKLLETQQQKERKNRQQLEIRVKSSLHSHNESEMKGSSSHQQRSDFMSSEKSQADSQSESKKQKLKQGKKDPKGLTIEDLQQNVNITLEETQTIFTFYMPSTSYPQENEDIKKRNVYYRQYCKKRIGSDNFVARPVQTFNFQHKKISEAVEKKPSADAGVLAASWQILETIKEERKSQFESLQEDIKKNVDKQLNNFLINPFSYLSLEKDSIDIHSRYQVPGAAEYFLKEKERNTKTKKGGLGIGTGSGMAQVSGSQSRGQDTKGYSDYRKEPSHNKRDQSSQNSNSRKNVRSGQIQMQIKQQQLKIQQQEKNFLEGVMNHAKKLPSEAEQKLMVNQHLERNLKYIDRILNSQTYHRQYILYRNYPQIQFTKKSQEKDNLTNFTKKRKEEKKEEVKDALQYLFSFRCKIAEGYSVTCADWNPVNKDLLAVSYQLIEKDTDSNDRQGINKGYLMFWTLKNPAFPEKIFTSESRITSCKFSVENPNLIACGTHDGVVMIYDIRKKDGKPISENKESLDKHTNAVWDIQWISKGKSNSKGESLVSISADGRITEWSMKKGLQFTDLMLLRRIPTSNKKETVQNMNFRSASGLSFEFLKNQSSMYLATTEQGVIYRCSKSYTQQYLQVYFGHNGPVYKVRGNPFFPDIFLTCSADWSCKLWNWRKDQPLNSFQSLDLTDQVIDIEWSPTESVLFASVCKDGRLELWDLEKKNMLDPIAVIRNTPTGEEKLASKTLVRFCKGAPVLITGDIQGDINVYRLNRDQDNLDHSHQTQKIVNLLYPNGYKMGTSAEQTINEVTHQNEDIQNDKKSNNLQQ